MNRGQTSIEALLVTAAGLAALALAAVAAVAIQQTLLQATIATGEAAALEKLAAAATETSAFAPGSLNRVELELSAQNTSFSYANGKLRLKYWHDGKSRAIERSAPSASISARNYSRGKWVAAIVNKGGTAEISITHGDLQEKESLAVKEQPA